MPAELLTDASRATDANGVPISGATWTFYATDSLTLQSVYTDAALTVAHANPVVADAGGKFAPIYFDASKTYRGILRDADGVTIDDIDPINSGSLDTIDSSAGSGLVGFLQSGSGAVAETVQTALRRMVYADQFGATFNGVTDDTTNLQKAFTAATANGGGVINFPPNKTVVISQSILVGSNTTVNLNGCTVKAKQSGFVGTNAGLTCFLFRNVNYSAASLTDSKIQINGPGTFDYGTVTISGGGAHAIAMRYVDNVTVRDVVGLKGENVTAFLACKDTLVENCEGYNQINCYFDHWDGAGTARVIGCVGRNDAGTNIAQGIQFTGTGSALENRTSLDAVVAFCTLEGVRNSSSNTASAIISNANDADSAAYRFRSIGNLVKDADLGIVFAGAGGQHSSLLDYLIQVDQLPAFAQTTDSDSPSNCTFDLLHLIDCDHTAGNLALISLSGAGHEVKRLKVINSGAAAYDSLVNLSASASNCTVDVSGCPTGAGQRVIDSGTASIVEDRYQVATSTNAAGYSFLPGERVKEFNGAGCTVTLPSAATYNGTPLYLFTTVAALVVSISSNVIPRAGGAAGTAILPATDGAWAMLIPNGTNWQIVASS